MTSCNNEHCTYIAVCCCVPQELLQFEQEVGYEFKHIRLLARSLTMRSIGFNNLTLYVPDILQL